MHKIKKLISVLILLGAQVMWHSRFSLTQHDLEVDGLVASIINSTDTNTGITIT